MSWRQVNVSFPEDLYKQFVRLVPAGERSRFLAQLTESGLRQIRLKQALGQTFGAWEKERHPELSKGTTAFMRRLRRSRR